VGRPESVTSVLFSSGFAILKLPDTAQRVGAFGRRDQPAVLQGLFPSGVSRVPDLDQVLCSRDGDIWSVFVLGENSLEMIGSSRKQKARL